MLGSCHIGRLAEKQLVLGHEVRPTTRIYVEIAEQRKHARSGHGAVGRRRWSTLNTMTVDHETPHQVSMRDASNT